MEVVGDRVTTISESCGTGLENITPIKQFQPCRQGAEMRERKKKSELVHESER